MSNAFFKVPSVVNEPVKSYAPGSPERAELKAALAAARANKAEIPMWIDGKDVKTGKLVEINPPHELKHVLGHFHRGDESHVNMAIDAALRAREQWANTPWEQRAAIFLKAAALLAGPYRAKMNAATMLGQSKSAFQAEIDSACELIDFWRYNVEYMTKIYADQPISDVGQWNRSEYRPLEGFVFALTPFNFTSIAGNLPTAPAMMGNTVVWKVSNQQVYSAQVLVDIFKEAGVPDGVINLIFVSGPVAGNVIFSHPDFAGIHFTGSTEVFQEIWKTIGNNIAKYKSYPRIVGETGGKDFVIAHHTSNPLEVATALTRGAFEYQGQKCSAASRAYIPQNLWNDVKNHMGKQLETIKMGGVEDFTNFFNAVIDKGAFTKISSYIDRAKNSDEAEIVFGGGYDSSVGYFIEPTVIKTSNPKYETMETELFGPVLTIYVYETDKFEEALELVDSTSPYALTGAVFARDRYAIQLATRKLVNAAGNFYINDKPTGAVVNQQPFGGARASGTNDKAGSYLNMVRWVSARSIKENLVPPTDYTYPFLQAD